MTPPFEGLLAGLRLAMNAGAQEANAAKLNGITDWNAVAGLARRHRVGSLLLRGVKASVNPAPEAVAALEPLRARTAKRGLRQLAGLREATERLSLSGIPSLVLKGLPLSARLFGTPLARECIDIDLLVPPETAAEAARALAPAGWRLVKPSFHPTPGRIRCYNRFAKNRLLVRPGSALELHHRLVNNPFLLSVSFARLSAKATRVVVGGHAFAALDDADLMIYLAVHGQLHRWSRLKWLCDMAALLASMDDSRIVAAVEHCRRERLRLEPVFGTALLLCREWFHVDSPAIFPPPGAWTGRSARLTRRLWNRPGGGKGLRGVARSIDELRLAQAMKPSWRMAAHEFARLWMAPHELGRGNLPDRLLFLHAALRPLLWLAGRFKRGDKRRPAAAGASEGVLTAKRIATARSAAAEAHTAGAENAASVPRGSRVYAIGDIHGGLGALARLMAMVRRDASQPGAGRRVLIFLGDYVDRGLESRQVLEFLLADPAPGFETVFLKGNHEALLLAFLDDAGTGRQWLAAGGQGTLYSYGISLPPGPRGADRLESLREEFAAALPGAHRAFLSGLAKFHVEGGYAFVHAGLRPGAPLEEQREEDLLWGSEAFIGDTRDHGKVIVHGHSFAPEPVVERNRIGIDTGAYATGRLTCLVLEGAARRFLST